MVYGQKQTRTVPPPPPGFDNVWYDFQATLKANNEISDHFRMKLIWGGGQISRYASGQKSTHLLYIPYKSVNEHVVLPKNFLLPPTPIYCTIHSSGNFSNITLL